MNGITEEDPLIAGPAILHTSSNAPVLVFALPEPLVRDALLPHMPVVLVALYLLFAPAVMPPRHAGSGTVEDFSASGARAAGCSLTATASPRASGRQSWPSRSDCVACPHREPPNT